MKKNTVKEPQATGATAPTQSAMNYYSVRGPMLLGALGIPCIILAAILGTGVWVKGWFAAQDARRTEILRKYDSLSSEAEAVRSVLSERSQQMDVLKVTPLEVVDKANALARSTGVRPHLITEKVSRAEGATLRGMTSASAPFRVVVRGTPEKIHQFFAQLETTYPSILVIATSMGPGQGEAASLLEVDTTYMVPAYAFSK